MRYEFKCEGCGQTVLLGDNEATTHQRGEVLFCGPLKRVWSFAIAWPQSERGH